MTKFQPLPDRLIASGLFSIRRNIFEIISCTDSGIRNYCELDKERDLDAITAVIPVSDEYARHTTKEIRDGDITDDELTEAADDHPQTQ